MRPRPTRILEEEYKILLPLDLVKPDAPLEVKLLAAPKQLRKIV